MNLYLVLAIALGVISTAVDAPVLRPVHLVARQECRRDRRQVRVASAVRARRTARQWWSTPCQVSRAPRLRGAGSPRAPSVG